MSRTLEAMFVADTARFKQGVSQIKGAMGDAGRQGGKELAQGVEKETRGIGSTLKRAIPWAAVAAGGVAAFGWLAGTAQDARESAKENAKLATVLKNMGKSGAVDALNDQASALQKNIGQSDEAIRATQSLLATFSNVAASAGETGGAFERATAAAHDMAAAGFGDAAGNAKQLGKALQDPIKGITALNRSGVTFTAAQKKQIEGYVKTGQAAKAQAMILTEVERQVGGSAAAQATNADKMKESWNDFREEVGNQVLPIIDGLQKMINEHVIPAVSNLLPKVISWATIMKDRLTPPVTAVAGFIRDVLVPGISTMAGWLNTNGRLLRDLAVGFGVVVAVMAAYNLAQSVMVAGGLVKFIMGVIKSTRLWAIAQGALNLIMSLNPIGIVILAITALVAAIVIAYRNSETFRNIVQAAWAGIQNAALWAWERVLKPVFTFLVAYYRTLWNIAVLVASKIVAAWVATTNGIRAAWNWIRGVFDAFRNGMSDLWRRAGETKDKIVSYFDAIRRGIVEKVSAAVAGFRQLFGQIQDAAKQPIRFVIETVLENGILAAFRKVAGAVGLDSLAEKMHVAVPAGFRDGGPTGRMNPRRIAGVVHGNEHVVTDREVRRTPGGHRTWARLRAMAAAGVLPGFFLGGRVPTSGPQNRHRSGYGWARWAGDIPAGMGAPVVAWGPGTVAATNRWGNSYGNHIRINGGGVQTLYAHLSKILVAVGQAVAAGQLIGRVGSTGNSTGPHLHFELSGGNAAIGRPTGVDGDTGDDRSLFQKAIDWVGNLTKAFTAPLGRLGEIGNHPLAQLMGAGVRGLVGGLKDKIKNGAGSGSFGAGTGTTSGGSGPAAQALAKIIGPMFGFNTIGTYPGHHPSQARALDFMTSSMGQGNAAAAYMQANARRLGVQYLIWNRRIWNIERNAEGWRHYFDGGSSNPNRAHTNHIHAALYDRGGWLMPGTTLAQNNTGRPERVVSGDNPIMVEVVFRDERLIDLIDVRVDDHASATARVQARKRVMSI